MPVELIHTCPGARSKEEALEQFWNDLRGANGPRRKDPEEYVMDVRVTQDRSVARKDGGGFLAPFRVHYRVPSNLRRGP